MKQVAGTAQAVSDRSASSLQAIVAGAIFALVIGIVASIWITRSITRPLNAGLAVANQVAAGDLTAAIHVTSDDEFGALLGALKTMNGNLTHMVHDIRRSAEAIHAAAEEVAEGNGDLSNRTEEQATHAGGDRRVAWKSSPTTVQAERRESAQARPTSSRSRRIQRGGAGRRGRGPGGRAP